MFFYGGVQGWLRRSSVLARNVRIGWSGSGSSGAKDGDSQRSVTENLRNYLVLGRGAEAWHSTALERLIAQISDPTAALRRTWIIEQSLRDSRHARNIRGPCIMRISLLSRAYDGSKAKSLPAETTEWWIVATMGFVLLLTLAWNGLLIWLACQLF
jgi:hypothetical protein